MMEEEKLRFQEEEGSFYEEEEEKQESEAGEDEGDHAPVDHQPVVSKEADVPRFKRSASDLSALSYEMFEEQSKHTGDNNKEDSEVKEDNLENEETMELVTSPSSQRKVSETFCYKLYLLRGIKSFKISILHGDFFIFASSNFEFNYQMHSYWNIKWNL